MSDTNPDFILVDTYIRESAAEIVRLKREVEELSEIGWRLIANYEADFYKNRDFEELREILERLKK